LKSWTLKASPSAARRSNSSCKLKMTLPIQSRALLLHKSCATPRSLALSATSTPVPRYHDSRLQGVQRLRHPHG